MSKNTWNATSTLGVVLALIIGAAAGAWLMPNETAGISLEDYEALKADYNELTELYKTANEELDSLKNASSTQGKTTTEEELSDWDVWKKRTQEVILEEFEHDDDFFVCGTHKFDNDEFEMELEDFSLTDKENGDVFVIASYEFDFDDNKDIRDCKTTRTFSVFWDEEDVEDEDWDNAEITWVPVSE